MKVLIIGGGLRGCVAARAAARRGAQVTMLESRQHLGHEITATGQEWLHSGKSEITLQVGALAKSLLAEQLELGTHVLLNAHAGGILTGNGQAAGALIANSYGTQLCQADLVIDTEEMLLSDIPTQQAEIRYAFVITSVTPMYLPEIPVPASFGLTNNTLRMHTSCRANCAVAELRFVRTIDAVTAGNPNRMLPAAQRMAIDVYSWLKANHPAFAEAGLHSSLYNEVRIFGIQRAQICEIAGYTMLKTALPEQMSRVSLTNMAEDITAEVAALMESTQSACAPDTIVTRDGKIALSECEFFEDPAVSFRNGLVLQAVKLPANAIAVRETVPVLVAGMGTSGLRVLNALCERNVKAAAVELYGIYSGTHGVGRVAGFYHGYRGGRVGEQEKLRAQITERYNIPLGGARLLQQNSYLFPQEEHFYFNTVVCGVSREGRRVKTVLNCDSRGLFRIAADIVVDATGDAIAAYVAGASYMLGDDRDGNVQTYSYWGESTWRSNSFLESRHLGDHDVVDMDSYEDFLRCVYLGQHDNSDIRYSSLLTVRESRRVVGDYVLNMDDVWDETPFDDIISVAMTPFDTHGKGSALYCDMGLTALNRNDQRIRLPYRCYIVRDLDNMLITAKAYSATREANSFGRMNADLRHAGYAVGLAAAQAILDKTDLRSVNLAPVQEELRRQEILPAWVDEQPPVYTGEELFRLAEEGNHYAIMKLFRTSAPEHLALLREKWEASHERSLILRLAAWHELPGAVDAAADKLIEILKKSAHDPMAKMPEYFLARNLMGALVRAEHINTDKLAQIISLTFAGGNVTYPEGHRYYNTIYGFDRVDGWKIPHFGFLYMIARAVERHADKEIAPAMETLLSRQYISGFAMHNGEAPESAFFSHNITPFYCALLELRLSAAAARCGSTVGWHKLQSFATEDRSLFRKFAAAELSEIGSEGSVVPCKAELVLR